MSEPTKAVFLSYSREDTDAARRIAEALRGFGVEVWFDQNELRGGDQWDARIRGQIKSCALFIPVISAITETRDEAYFRLEWKLADDRSHLMAPGKPFIVPVVIDQTPETGASVPESFARSQWTRLDGGEPSTAFIEQVKRLLETSRRPAPKPDLPPESRPAAQARAEAAASSAKKTSPILALWILLAVVAVSVVVFFVTGQRDQSAPARPAEVMKPAVVVPAVTTMHDDMAVAVLPFANLSGDKDQEYFSDGLTEEILNALAREPDLRVPGRASAFSFKGKNASPAEIAKALNVSRFVEGSVRKSGNKVRINVSLTRAADGFSEELGTFTEELSDVFALQQKVARVVVE